MVFLKKKKSVKRPPFFFLSLNLNKKNVLYHTSQISEFHAILNANAQLRKNRSHLFHHTSQMGEFETILNANTRLKNTLNFRLPRITDKRISGYFKCKCTINEERIKFLLLTLNLPLLPLKNTLNSLYHTLQISEFKAMSEKKCLFGCP